MYRIICRNVTTAAEQVNNSVPKGRFQHWRKPVYQAPHINPLEIGPDFTFKDSKPVLFTSHIQVENKLEQLRLANEIVKALNEIKQIEEAHSTATIKRTQLEAEVKQLKPTAKGEKHLL